MDESANQTLDRIQQMIDDLDVRSVFGDAVKEGDYTLIPVARVMYGFGYGSGSGPVKPKNKDGDDEAEAAEAGESAIASGGGGGAGGRVTPQGYIRIGPDGVRYDGTYNATLIPIAGMITGMWSLLWIAVTIMTAVVWLGRGRGKK